MRKAIALLFIVVLIAGCASFKQKRSVSKPLVTIAMEKIHRDDVQGALVELKRAVATNPKDPEIYYAYAIAYSKSGKYDKAIENIDKAIEYADNIGLEHPGMKSEAYNLKGSILVTREKPEEAIKAFQNAVNDELYTTPEYSYYNLACVYFSMKRYPEAAESAKQALNRNPHYAPAWKILSQAYIAQGEEDQGINALRHAVLEFNGYTEAYWDLALIHMKRGEIREAIKNLNEVIRLDAGGPFGNMAEEKLQALEPASR